MPDYPNDDCYDILGVDQEASQDFIKQTYKKLAQIYHPDKLSSATERDRAAAVEKFKRIKEAYEILEDPDSRRAYAEWRRQTKQPPRPRVTPDEIDFGTLRPGESRTISVTVHNDGGPATSEVNFSMGEDPSPFRLSPPPSDEFPIVIQVTFEASYTASTGDVLDTLTVTLDGAAAATILRARIKAAPATASSTTFSTTSHASSPIGSPPSAAAPGPSHPMPPPSSALGRGWAIAVGCFVFMLVLVFGQAFQAQTLHAIPQQSLSWLPGAIFYSLFGAAVFAGMAMTGFLRRKRNRGVVAAALGAVSSVTFLILLATAGVGPSQPKPVTPEPSLPVQTAAVRRQPQTLDCDNLALRLYNIDDYIEATIANASGPQVFLKIPERQDTGFVDFGPRTRPGINTLSLQLMNYRGGYTYGYQVRSNTTIVDQASCGQVGIMGCNNNDLKTGLVFTHSFTFACPGAAAQAANSTSGDAPSNPEITETAEHTSGSVDDPKGGTAISGVNVNWEDISFSIGPCSTQGDSISCASRLVNNGDDRRIRLGLARDSRIIDDSGYEFPVSGGELGANSCRGCDVSSTLVSGVPIVGSVTFREARQNRAIASDTRGALSAISVLELRVNVNERGWSTLQFRDVPLRGVRNARTQNSHADEPGASRVAGIAR